jgi:hypothetical protein
MRKWRSKMYEEIIFEFDNGMRIPLYKSDTGKLEIDCPNKQQGIGDIIFPEHRVHVWCNGIHMSLQSPRVHLCHLHKVLLVSLCEEDPDILLWKNESNPKKFSYEYWYKATEDIKAIIKEQWIISLKEK